ncbi:guanylate kinase [Candidatus Phytoplasma pini]|uniref:Guanylate kinase n=1 Tax=Candidatus Phytoplasma pini TaxID=267362 RepID=A0A559KJQ4_9MOLU|nr:guanylate kinase [Candidatus Phytoplasma pini]TVY12363.1 Guanylate kinase [Candidatus Phytoplasma pini]
MKLHIKGLMIVISGPSGVGKEEIKKSLFRREKNNFVYSISMTTRPPRVNEKDGIDYFFVSKEEFRKKIKENYFLEYNNFVDHYYGTPYRNILKQLKQEKKEVVLEIDVQGALKIKKHKVNKDGVFIFISPPSRQILYERLKNRNTESKDILLKRIAKADEEFNLAYKYDYIVVNDEIENAVDKIMSIITAEHSKVKNSINVYLSEIVNK